MHNYLCTKCEGNTSVVFTPSHCVLKNNIIHVRGHDVKYLIRVGPEQVAEQPLVWYVCWPHDSPKTNQYV